LRAGFVRFDLAAVMHAADADTFLRPLLDLRDPRAIAFHHFVIRPAVHVEDNRVRAVENLFVLRPAVEHEVTCKFRAPCARHFARSWTPR
jgi:hypothetical protein